MERKIIISTFMIPETPERGHKYYTQVGFFFFFPLDRLKSPFFLKASLIREALSGREAKSRWLAVSGPRRQTLAASDTAWALPIGPPLCL